MRHYEDFCLWPEDYSLAARLKEFLPQRIFDAHMHIYDSAFTPCVGTGGFARPRCTVDNYRTEMAALFPTGTAFRCHFLPAPDRSFHERKSGNRMAALRFMAEQLDVHPDCTGSAYVLSEDTAEDIEGLCVHPRIRGLKCYYYAAGVPNPAAHQFLPEAAWEIADARKLCITLHLMRDDALSDPENLQDIRKMAARYPNARLILAHCGRAFNAWSCWEPVRLLAEYPNVYYDLAAICEPAPIFRCIQAAGASHVLWGSDWPIAMCRGRVVSLAEGFRWLSRRDLQLLSPDGGMPACLFALENLFAFRQAADMLSLSRFDTEKIFYENANSILGTNECAAN